MDPQQKTLCTDTIKWEASTGLNSYGEPAASSTGGIYSIKARVSGAKNQYFLRDGQMVLAAMTIIAYGTSAAMPENARIWLASDSTSDPPWMPLSVQTVTDEAGSTDHFRIHLQGR